eukprot:CAMPEP_0178988498 /NCGR_PEP_ID=MMETSP0795-20121207/3842_1 /TAXON_ID=88552 /ORGANISM="Amoebophrya sp., Strain Ameob2" /LENGTH=546 /DNA_ID=CAMNT_0020679775 /DNA_START=93 /DNA_END=1733 /DNA_ORIENTATION=+
MPKPASTSPKVGIDWPPECGGKTTGIAKSVWAACAKAGGRDDLAAAIEAEKNWRFGYAPHVRQIAELLAGDRVLDVCKAGLDAMSQNLVFRSSSGDGAGTVETLAALSAAAPASSSAQEYFDTKIVKGEGAFSAKKSGENGGGFSVPYKGKNLAGADLADQLRQWADYGTCEADCVPKIERAAQDLGPLKDRWFVLLGAGSELGPLKPLLEQGARVVAVRTRREKEWDKMEAFAKTTPGTLYVPTRAGARGADILTEPVQIRDWVLGVITAASVESQSKTPAVADNTVTVGMYTYLDAEAHVRVTMGCDLIMNGLLQTLTANKTPVRLAYLCTNSMPLPINRSAFDAIEENRARAPLAVQWSGCERNPVSLVARGGGGADTEGGEDNKVHAIYHCIFEAQGPNYVLAKFLQLFRALLANNESAGGDKKGGSGTSSASLNVAPACYTESVTHAPTMKYLLNAMHLIPPQEAFQPETARALMFLLLAWDCGCGRNQGPTAGAASGNSPLALALTGSFHGGSLRAGFNIEKSKLLSTMMYMYGRFWAPN